MLGREGEEMLRHHRTKNVFLRSPLSFSRNGFAAAYIHRLIERSVHAFSINHQISRKRQRNLFWLWRWRGAMTSERKEASVLMQRLSYATDTVLSNKITRNRIVLSFKDSPRKPFGRRPRVAKVRVTYEERGQEGSAFPEAARKGVFHLGRPQTFGIFLPLPTCPQIHATSLTKVAYYVCF